MRSHEHELDAEIARKKLRLAVFGEVDKDEFNARGPELEQMYRQDILIPESVNRWAHRTDQDLANAKETFVITIFEKDIEVAEEYKKGVQVGNKTVLLSDLRREEYVTIINLQNQKKKLSQS